MSPPAGGQRLQFRVRARCGAGEAVNPLLHGVCLEDLRAAICAALIQHPVGEEDEPGVQAPQVTVSLEEAGDPCGRGDPDVHEAAAVPAMVVSVDDVMDVRAMQELRNQVLSGDFDSVASRALSRAATLPTSASPSADGLAEGGLSLQADRSEFAEQFESSALALEVLTPHQSDKLAECDRLEGDVHLRAPAGAGKTFVALHRALDVLRRSPSDSVLFVARNEALAYFAASWLGKRAAAGVR